MYNINKSKRFIKLFLVPMLKTMYTFFPLFIRNATWSWKREIYFAGSVAAPDPGWERIWIRLQDEHPRSFFRETQFFGLKSLMRIRDPEAFDPGSGIRNKHPQHCNRRDKGKENKWFSFHHSATNTAIAFNSAILNRSLPGWPCERHQVGTGWRERFSSPAVVQRVQPA